MSRANRGLDSLLPPMPKVSKRTMAKLAALVVDGVRAALAFQPSPIERRAIKILRKRGPMTASNLGAELWGTASRKPQAYARPAGRLLKRLRDAGLVVRSPHEVLTMWRAR